MIGGLDRLHPVILHHLVNSLGWQELRPFQEQAIGPLLDGADVLLLAPTAGGKTEAAVFPLLTAMDVQRWSGLSLIYVCPLKALLNNLQPRLEQYAGWLGRRVAVWHGDVTASGRQRILRDPPDLLLTTPESLEAMLISVKVQQARLFAGIRAIVVDEVHAFGSDDRGWHLLAVLERLSRLAERPIQRVGLSATIGNPGALLDWLQGSGRGSRRGVVVAPDVGLVLGGQAGTGSDAGSGAGGAALRLAASVDVELDYVGSVGNAAHVIASLHRGEKRLVFCDTRQLVEELGAALRELGVTTFLSHASLGADVRHRSEQAFAEARDCVIVSTSTLELGIDVGDLDRVIQVNCPSTVAAFLQRIGRTGTPAWQHAELPLPRHRRRIPAVAGRPAAPVGPVVRGAGGRAARAAAHRGPATARDVPAGAPDRPPALGRRMERPRAVRPQRRADPAVPGRQRIHRSRTASCCSSARPRRRSSVTATSWA